MEPPPGETRAAALDLDKVIALFLGPNSSDLHDRHVASIQKLCKGNPQGFAIRDLAKVQQILELSIALLERGGAEFLDPVCELVSLLGKPFIRRTATDEFRMLSNITSVLATLGTIFRGPLPTQLQLAALQAVTAFANAHGSRPSTTLNAVSTGSSMEAESSQRQYHANQSLVCKSGVTADIVQALADALTQRGDSAGGTRPRAGSGQLLPALLSALLSLSYYADNCSQMVQAGVLQCLAALLAAVPSGSGDGDIRVAAAGPAVELLWNVLESAPGAREVLGTQLPTLEAVAQGAARAAAAAAASTEEATAASGPDESSSTAGGPAPEPAANVAGRRHADADAGALSHHDMDANEPSSTAETESGSAMTPEESHDHAAAAAGLSHQQSSYEYGGAASREDSYYFPNAAIAAALGAPNGAPALTSVQQPLAEALSALLQSLLLHGCSQADKELRNDTLVVLNLLLEAEGFRQAAAYAGAFTPILAAATCPEAGARPGLVHAYALTTDVLDHEMKLLAWGGLLHGCLLPEVLSAAVTGGFMRVLLLYANPGESHPVVRRWNADQLAALRAAALSKLHQVSPLCPDEYERAGGPAVLLSLVAANPPLPAQHLEAGLRHLHRLFSMVPETRDAFGAGGLVPLLLDLVQDIAGRAEGVRHFAMMCLSTMCTMHAENQRRVRKAQGVTVLLSALSKLRALDPLLPSPYAVAVVDCVWCCVVPDRKSTARFLVSAGMDHLLNFLETGNKAHRPIILSLLCDLLENPRAHQFFHEWRSDVNKQTAANMMVASWLEEDALRGMTQGGVLTNTARPLKGMERRMAWMPAETVAYGNLSPAKKEMLQVMSNTVPGEALLAKIYSAFKLLGFDQFPYLDVRGQATLAAVEKYAKFRQGEVWRAIQAEFNETGMRPTAPDRARLQSGIDLSESLAVAVREAQARLLGRAQDEAKVVEGNFFEAMRAQRKLEAESRFMQQHQDGAALTLAELRAAKDKKEAMLKSSMQEFVYQSTGGDDMTTTAAIAVQ